MSTSSVKDHQWLMTLAFVFITLLYLGVRLLNLDVLVTTDEPFWLGRSANFYRALVTQDWEHTYQMAHPGVMTMWAGAVAYLIEFPEYAQLTAGNMQVPYGIEKHLRDMGQDPLTMMVAAKISKLIMQTIFFAISMHILRKLVDSDTAVLCGLLIAFSPMMSGFDSALHVDGLFTAIAFCALLLICWAGFHDVAVAR